MTRICIKAEANVEEKTYLWQRLGQDEDKEDEEDEVM